MTIDHVNPEAPWPEVDRLRAATEERGLSSRQRLALYPEYVADIRSDGATTDVATAVLRASDADGLARAERLDGRAAAVPPRSLGGRRMTGGSPRPCFKRS